MSVCVVALGKIGLPLAVQFALQGASVAGVDINPDTVRLVNEGKEPFPGEAGLQTALQRVVESGHLRATTDTTAAVNASDVVVLVVPLFVDSQGVPDFASMDAATRAIGRGLEPGTLVSYETTLPVGTTRQRFAPMLEKESGLIAGRDFHLAFSPERVLTGRVFADLRRYPKLVGGLTAECGEAAKHFYESVLEFDERADLARRNGVWDLGSCEASEMAKLAETTYRDVNIGLANQFAKYASHNNIDVYKVIEACNSQPYSHIHQPGIAVGGHCIPIYPQMYLWNDPDATIVRAAREANWSMPGFAARQLEGAVGTLEGKHVAVLGVSYRGGVKEHAFSGVFPTVEELQNRGAIVTVHDPMYSDDEIRSLGLVPMDPRSPLDAAVIQADHKEYEDLRFLDVTGCSVILAGRAMSVSHLPRQCRVVQIAR